MLWTRHHNGRQMIGLPRFKRLSRLLSLSLSCDSAFLLRILRAGVAFWSRGEVNGDCEAMPMRVRVRVPIPIDVDGVTGAATGIGGMKSACDRALAARASATTAAGCRRL